MTWNDSERDWKNVDCPVGDLTVHDRTVSEFPQKRTQKKFRSSFETFQANSTLFQYVEDIAVSGDGPQFRNTARQPLG
jgi:hypothetical protein